MINCPMDPDLTVSASKQHTTVTSLLFNGTDYIHMSQMTHAFAPIVLEPNMAEQLEVTNYNIAWVAI